VIPHGLDRAVVGGTSALGAVILTACVVLAGDHPPLLFLRLGLVPLAAAAAFVLDDPAAPAVDAVPRTRRRRTADRTVGVALPLGVWATGVGALELRVPATAAAGLLVEGAGALAVGLALAALLRWAGRAEPGEIAASAVGGTMLALLVFDLPSWWPAPVFPGDDGWAASTALWGGLTLTAAVLVALTSADAWRRIPVGRRPAHVPWPSWRRRDPEPGGGGRPSPDWSRSSWASRR